MRQRAFFGLLTLRRPVLSAPAPVLIPTRLAWALCCCWLPAWAQAQAVPEAALVLRPSAQLQAAPAPQVFVEGDQITGQSDIQATVDGNAELRRGDTIIRADRVVYDVPQDTATASGRVRIKQDQDIYRGTQLHMQVNAFSGFFSDVNYRFGLTGAHGQAERVDFIDRDRAIVHQANYTTCEKTDEASWQPDWILRARSMHLDKFEDVGVAEGAVLEFKGVPILPVPAISFPLSDKRKSGLLPPTIGLDSLSGLEYAQPYYWNIAPNRDATITPVLMTRRGVALAGEFRYLEPSYSGQLSGSYMPSDALRHENRWSYGIKHAQQMASPWGAVGLDINLRRVSDDNYWRDFSSRWGGGDSSQASLLTQRLLPGEASLRWAEADHSLSLRALRWQTLQDLAAPITPPYDRLPQLHWQYLPQRLGAGLELNVEADYTSFHSQRALTGQPNAQRSYALAQISRPFTAPAGFVTPKLQLHSTQYQFDAPLANGQRSQGRTLPTVSLDSGLFFERDAIFFGRSLLQTLEPRAFYTYTPYRDQNLLPVYDTAPKDFNFASIYSENAFSGQDRLVDNNLLTLGVNTRLLDPDTGAEAARFGIAQRVRLSDQKVTMPGGAVAQDRLSDLLLGAGLRWTPQWGFDATVQYNPKTQRSIRSTVAASYSPSKYRTVSAAYRLQKATALIAQPSEQLDVAWQWPLGDLWGDQRERPTQAAGRWFSVGRMNYSLREDKLTDAVVGLEYESCCWVGRVVLERLQRSVNASNTRVMFQIEFSGFSRLSLGANPLSSLRQYVPNYQPLGSEPRAPSPFQTFD